MIKKVEGARLNAPIVNPFNFADPYIQGKQDKKNEEKNVDFN